MNGTDTIALVTGANKGIGHEIARQLGELGMTVLLGARDPGRRDEATAKLRAEGLEVHPLTIDVTDEEGVRAAAQQVGERFGRLDVLVNNAADFRRRPADARLGRPRCGARGVRDQRVRRHPGDRRDAAAAAAVMRPGGSST